MKNALEAAFQRAAGFGSWWGGGQTSPRMEAEAETVRQREERRRGYLHERPPSVPARTHVGDWSRYFNTWLCGCNRESLLYHGECDADLDKCHRCGWVRPSFDKRTEVWTKARGAAWTQTMNARLEAWMRERERQ